MPLQRRRFAEAHDVRNFPFGSIQVVEIGDTVIGRVEYEPGWRWSKDVKPSTGTDWCEHHHLLLIVSGLARVMLADGPELDLAPGELAEVPPGHDAWVVGDEAWVAYDLSGMRTYGRSKDVRPDRVLASIVMTDIVDSTRIAGELGLVSWRDLLADHNRTAGDTVERHRGRLVKTTGDGILAVFDGAERAVRSAADLRDASKSLGLSIRAGVHTGEVETTSEDVRGLAVHTAARIMSVAGRDEIFVSATVRDLVDGTDLQFDDAGLHELKGLHGSRQLYRLR